MGQVKESTKPTAVPICAANFALLEGAADGARECERGRGREVQFAPGVPLARSRDVVSGWPAGRVNEEVCASIGMATQAASGGLQLTYSLTYRLQHASAESRSEPCSSTRVWLSSSA